MFRLTF